MIARSSQLSDFYLLTHLSNQTQWSKFTSCSIPPPPRHSSISALFLLTAVKLLQSTTLENNEPGECDTGKDSMPTLSSAQCFPRKALFLGKERFLGLAGAAGHVQRVTNQQVDVHILFARPSASRRAVSVSLRNLSMQQVQHRLSR